MIIHFSKLHRSINVDQIQIDRRVAESFRNHVDLVKNKDWLL